MPFTFAAEITYSVFLHGGGYHIHSIFQSFAINTKLDVSICCFGGLQRPTKLNFQDSFAWCAEDEDRKHTSLKILH